MDYKEQLGEILDGMGQLTANGWELVIDRDAGSGPLGMWRLTARKPSEKPLTASGHSLGLVLKSLVKKYERATGRKAAK